MRICIVGWYGTETLGDRAILDGITRVFNEVDSFNTFLLGSLYPHISERTLYEDRDLYAKSNTFEIFDIKEKQQLISAVKTSDIIIMGGGPLLDLEELHIVLKAFKYAKKYEKKTAILGCGYGPLKKKEHLTIVQRIVDYSDLIIMRSENCSKQLSSKHKLNGKKAYSLCDPAMISVVEYAKCHTPNPVHDDYWVVNLRDLDYVYQLNVQDELSKFINDLSSKVSKIILLPNNTNSLGGDDRYFLNKIEQNIGKSNVYTQMIPLSLSETYSVISNASGCIGMRYHAIVFQTILNGNNYIIDYTDPVNGKIISFLNELSNKEFYSKRYINIKYGAEIPISHNNGRFEFDTSKVENDIKQYILLLNNLMKETAYDN